ncbi:SNARE associated Golgi protein [Candidatus Anstonella stagnisolia]|nr:SNARE associated Golgi protein [Candidatus Anstonella stagnisolia]
MKKNSMKKKSLLTLENAKSLFTLLFAIGISIGAFVLSSEFSKNSELFIQLGYPGVFIIALVSSATMFLPAPGFAIIFAMSAFLNPLLVGFVAGVGSGIGELTSYLVGYSGSSKVSHTKIYLQHKKGLQKYGMPAIFVLSALPNPVLDIAGIAAGAIKMPLWKFLLATIAGKIVKYLFIAYTGFYLGGYFI